MPGKGHTLTDEQLRVTNLIRSDRSKPPLDRAECDARWKPLSWSERKATLAVINNRYVRNGYQL